jgi:hypothetical protein
VIKRGAIVGLSNLGKIPIDEQSLAWLERSAGRERIRTSGLWNVNRVEEVPNHAWIEVLRSGIDTQLGG